MTEDDTKPQEDEPLNARDEAAAVMGEQAEDAEDIVEEGLEAVETGEAEAGTLEPPNHWSAEHQEIFRDVPENVQQYLLSVDESTRAPLQSRLDALSPYQQIDEVWNPYFQQLGVPAAQTINGLLQAHQVLRTGTDQQKMQLLGTLVRDFGIPVEEEGLPEELASDPVAATIHPQVQALQQELANLRSQMQANASQQTASQTAQRQQAFESWGRQADAEGRPLRPHFEEVKGMMLTLAQNAITTGQQIDVDSAYEQACWATPSVRAKIQAADRAAGVAKRKAEAAKKQRASSSVTGSPAGSRTIVEDKGSPNESAHDTARRVLEELSGGA